MKKSGLADSPFFEKKHKEAARSFRPSKASDRQVADRTAVQEDAPTSGQDTRKPRGGESDRPADHSDGMTAGRQDGMTAVYTDDLIETIRGTVKDIGKERSEHRMTIDEKEALVDIVYHFKRQGMRTTENEVARIAMNFVLADYRRHGDQSLLVRVINALNA